MSATQELYAVSVEDINGRYWTTMDTRAECEKWVMRTLVMMLDTEQANISSPYLSFQPRVTQFSRITR
jgi:hypothetical protein